MSRRKPVAVDLEALLGRHLQGQVDREALGVVQLERLVARGASAPPAALVFATAVSRMVVPGGEGAEERLLLGVRDLADPVEVGLQLGVGLADPLAARPTAAGRHRVVYPQQARERTVRRSTGEK